MTLADGVIGTAEISDDERYRYTLTRSWGTRPLGVLWIMLNPSTASAEDDDPTLRRVQSFTRAWSYDRLVVANLFALRATDPKALHCAAPIGDDNDARLEALMRDQATDLVIAAWGTHGGLRFRDAAVIAMAGRCDRSLHALELTKNGKPKHPLYAKGDRKPIVFRGAT